MTETAQTVAICHECNKECDTTLTSYEYLTDPQHAERVRYCSVLCMMRRLTKLADEIRLLTQLVYEHST